MSRKATPLETAAGLNFGKILANQEIMMKMLSEISATSGLGEASDIYEKRLQEARKLVPRFTENILEVLLKS